MSLDNLAVEWSVIDLESLSEFIIGGDWGKDTSLAEENYIEVEENIILMVKYLIPLNLILALISVYFGVVLRGY